MTMGRVTAHWLLVFVLPCRHLALPSDQVRVSVDAADAAPQVVKRAVSVATGGSFIETSVKANISLLRREDEHSSSAAATDISIQHQESVASNTDVGTAFSTIVDRLRHFHRADFLPPSLLQTGKKEDPELPEEKAPSRACESELSGKYMDSVDDGLKTCLDTKLRRIGDYGKPRAKASLDSAIVECFGRMFLRTKPTEDECGSLREMLVCEKNEGKIENADMAIEVEKQRQKNCPGKDSCFPGEALVQVKDVGQRSMADLQVGDEVLVQSRGANQVLYEPVLDFLHVSKQPSANFLSLVHEMGELRVSDNHIVFVVDGDGQRVDKSAFEVRLGDKLMTVTDEGALLREVLEIRLDQTDLGMYAPLTASGELIVDGAVVSNYAYSPNLWPLSHASMHSVCWALRVYYQLGLDSVWRRAKDKKWMQDNVKDKFHPFVATGRYLLSLST